MNNGDGTYSNIGELEFLKEDNENIFYYPTDHKEIGEIIDINTWLSTPTKRLYVGSIKTDENIININYEPYIKENVGFAYAVDEKGHNINGGDFVTGRYRKRELNTIKFNSILNAKIENNSLILPAGEYKIEYMDTSYYVNGNTLHLYDETLNKSIDFITGYASVYDYDNKIFNKVLYKSDNIIKLSLYHHSQRTQNGNGFGIATNVTKNIYSYIKVWKL